MKKMSIQGENWQTVKEILQAVLQIEPSRRGEFLERAAAPAEIRREVESLLACAAESANFMSLPVTDFSKDFSGEAAADVSLVGQRVGIYEIVGEIGTGGMGAVYLAKRADGKFSQRVAVKMLKREFNTERLRRLFRREREIQSKLNHPNIARLLDAGKCADGIPFLVMEFVEGVPIDKYCASKNLSLAARLKLFNKVCDGVMNAHRNLIVHHDLKPSNILVNDDGEPKLLDFGISKLLDVESGEDRPAATLLGAMTPEYAAPEQIRGEPVTTASDVYSLGVVLFKILTGGYPYNFKNLTNGNLLKEIAEAKVIDVLFELSEKIETEFPENADISAELHHRFAEVFQMVQRAEHKNPRADRAREKMTFHARRALDLRKQFYGERHELVARDLFYLYASGGAEQKQNAKLLMEAVEMMRETNPRNLNLPYMLDAYSARLMMPEFGAYHEEFRHAVSAATTENNFQIAEKMLLEALPIFREHYRADNPAIYANVCKLGYAQTMQNKFAEAAPHLQICREAESKLKDEKQLEAIRKFQSQIAVIAAANNR